MSKANEILHKNETTALDPSLKEGGCAPRLLKSLRRIKGGSFSGDDITAYETMMAELVERHMASADELQKVGGAPVFVTAIRETAVAATSTATQFIDAFRAAAEDLNDAEDRRTSRPR
jgi:hypothetical protein